MENDGTAGEHRPAARISTDRAQDWITSVINPIIDGMERERRHLDAGVWAWEPFAKRFEYLHPISGNVSEFYLDNLEDFLDQYPQFKARFEEHDESLRRLTAVVEKTYQLLRNDSIGEPFRALFHRMAAGRSIDISDLALDYFCAHIASGFRTLPENYANVKLYNEHVSPWLEQSFRDGGALAEAIRAPAPLAERLKELATSLRDGLKACRREIANRYGARIRPVEW